MAFYTAALAADQWMWCIFLGLGSLLWGQVHWSWLFLARDSMLSALYAIARPSVRPSVCHTGGSVKNV